MQREPDGRLPAVDALESLTNDDRDCDGCLETAWQRKLRLRCPSGGSVDCYPKHRACFRLIYRGTCRTDHNCKFCHDCPVLTESERKEVHRTDRRARYWIPCAGGYAQQATWVPSVNGAGGPRDSDGSTHVTRAGCAARRKAMERLIEAEARGWAGILWGCGEYTSGGSFYLGNGLYFELFWTATGVEWVAAYGSHSALEARRIRRRRWQPDPRIGRLAGASSEEFTFAAWLSLGSKGCGTGAILPHVPLVWGDGNGSYWVISSTSASVCNDSKLPPVACYVATAGTPVPQGCCYADLGLLTRLAGYSVTWPNRNLDLRSNLNRLRWNLGMLQQILDAVSRAADELACWQHSVCVNCRISMGQYEPLWPGMPYCCDNCESRLRVHWLPDLDAYYSIP